MPKAYHDDRITQQWSKHIDREGFMRIMRVKQHFLDLIRKGDKTLEVRVGYSAIKSIQPGERINLMSRADHQIIRVLDVRTYQSFDEMFNFEQSERIVPGMSFDETKKLLKEIYPPEKEKLGIIVLEITPERN